MKFPERREEYLERLEDDKTRSMVDAFLKYRRENTSRYLGVKRMTRTIGGFKGRVKNLHKKAADYLRHFTRKKHGIGTELKAAIFYDI